MELLTWVKPKRGTTHKSLGALVATLFRNMDVTKPYRLIGFGDIHGPKPYEFIRFADIRDPKPYEFIGFGAATAAMTEHQVVSGRGQAPYVQRSTGRADTTRRHSQA